MTVPLNEQTLLERVTNEKKTETQAPLTRTVRSELIAKASGADGATPIAVGVDTGSVTGVTYTPAADIVGAATNARVLSVINRGSANLGSATVATLTLGPGVHLPANVATAIPLAVEAPPVASGDVLVFESTHTGTGIADPGGQAAIKLGRTVHVAATGQAGEAIGYIGTAVLGS